MNKKAAIKKYTAVSIVLLVFISLGSTSRYMIKSHPDFQVFFNVLAKRDQWKNYDLDYWGNSFGAGYKAAYREIDEDIVTISGSNIPAKMNAYFLPKKYREKIRYVDDAWRARYFICNWRNDDFRKKAWNGQWMFQEPVYILRDADGTPTVGIYKNPYYGIDPNK